MNGWAASSHFLNSVQKGGYHMMLADRLASGEKGLSIYAAELWPTTRQIPRLSQTNLSEEYERQDDICLFGLLYVLPKRRVSVLKAYSKLLPPVIARPPIERVVQDDVFFLEDAGVKLRLDLSNEVKFRTVLIPGAVVAVRGHLQSNNGLAVSEIMFSSRLMKMEPQPPSSLLTTNNDVVVIVSGLGLGGADPAQLRYSMELLDFLVSLRGLRQGPLRLIICGNLFAAPEDAPAAKSFMDHYELSPTTTFAEMHASYDIGDAFLKQCIGLADVILIPGSDDPTTHMWPQDPVPELLLQRAAMYTRNERSFQRLPCPCILQESTGTIYFIDAASLQYLKQYIVWEGKDNATEEELASLLLLCGNVCPLAPLYMPSKPLANDAFRFPIPPTAIIIGSTTRVAASTVTYIWEGQPKQCTIICVPRLVTQGRGVLFCPATGAFQHLCLARNK
ncbi:DNA-directed DNA polymerase [Giardia muris]|uniref:DNA-directed DNA polymerase n=1 Tax=Giardia muris TaxID=5742 RepID=A0A4Z1T139_GIAMU|nr:DNA-directed DNA polymerase [Giardia muris]|eukprot:TNJ30685.1 DNA-directed DNA polymerase [Giardia muris]